MESLIAIVVKPPIEISEQIKSTAQKAFVNCESEPHISLGSAFNCSRKNFVKKTNDWLQMQKQLVFTLNKVACFPRIVYLTSNDQREVDDVADLYFGLKSLLETDIRYRQNNPKFVPHLTLQDSVRQREIKETMSQFSRVFCNPIVIPITEIEIHEKISQKRWETIDSFKIGGENMWDQLLLDDMYQFNQNNRASIG